ncbi:quinolinate synthase NadA [Flavobacterium sp. J49]|uniref:quinolinate synthase NadA n=1 Tax=Flavobacterium sp. J49 TaxID=2718534 RepID=UPI001594918D|nr:quinolinate synthase NadA [Flavobacterium sp. J49]MBF6641603.1 quinolinate synthase NadA [Flavobacterium sp. J49]NIC02850.1 quinolinate synthase NadA [Flavobacterium sp. J49]
MESLKEKILQLKKEKNAVILAHYYQQPEIQEIADYVGDSLGLSQEAKKVNADIIVFAGVHFMAETAKLLNPKKKVLLPDLEAGCSLAESCPPDIFKKFIDAHPHHIVITYVNCSAEIKALSHIVCTSSNAEKIVNSVPENIPIIFAPDKNLGNYINQKTGRKMLLWDGSCVVHEAFSLEKLIALYKEHPDAGIIAHPESENRILETASYIGSTSGMIDFVKRSPKTKFIVATEAGILYKMQEAVPDKILIPAPALEDNTCACSECAYMKLNTLRKVYDCLLHESPEIKVPKKIADKAIIPIQRMLELSK